MKILREKIANENYINNTTDYFQLLKVDLDFFPDGKGIEIVSNSDNISFFSIKIIFINDKDISQVFRWRIKNEVFIEYL